MSIVAISDLYPDDRAEGSADEVSEERDVKVAAGKISSCIEMQQAK